MPGSAFVDRQAIGRQERARRFHCGGDARLPYEGCSFALVDCRDGPAVKRLDPPAAPWPRPCPQANVPDNGRFDHADIAR